MIAADTTLADLAERYDVFFIDQFGVLHDGQSPYPGAVDALSWLTAIGKRTILISNSGKRSKQNVERLRSLGFAENSYESMLSSGELAWTMLSENRFGDLIGGETKCLLLARGGDRSAIAGLKVRQARSADDADVILLAGSRGDEISLADYAALLGIAAERRVPCLCTNPDKLMLTPSGLRFGAGAIADMYEQLGGPVTRIGKPFPAIYDAALRLTGYPPKATVCCIGDSIEHDIAGGRSAGLKTALVRTGIHGAAGEDELTALCETFGATPDHRLIAFAPPEGQ